MDKKTIEFEFRSDITLKVRTTLIVQQPLKNVDPEITG